MGYISIRSLPRSERMGDARRGTNRLGAMRTKPSGTGRSLSPRTTNERRFRSSVPMIWSPRPGSRQRSMAQGLFEMNESAPPSMVNPSTRSVQIAPPIRSLASRTTTSMAASTLKPELRGDGPRRGPSGPRRRLPPDHVSSLVPTGPLTTRHPGFDSIANLPRRSASGHLRRVEQTDWGRISIPIITTAAAREPAARTKVSADWTARPDPIRMDRLFQKQLTIHERISHDRFRQVDQRRE
jgi:hypothetical protein